MYEWCEYCFEWDVCEEVKDEGSFEVIDRNQLDITHLCKRFLIFILLAEAAAHIDEEKELDNIIKQYEP